MKPFTAVALASALLLAACAGRPLNPDVAASRNIYPPNYKTEVLALMQSYLNDPVNVRGAGIADPVLKDIPGVGNRYATCVRYNARNPAGQYAGVQETVIVFLDGRLDRVVEGAKESCKDAAYLPYPELERLPPR